MGKINNRLMKELKVNVPDFIADFLDRLPGANRHTFIINALISKINDKNNPELEKLLAEGYKNDNQESSELKKEFNDIDIEHWDEY